MDTLVRSLHPAGEYSRVLVLPRDWLMRQGNPQSVRIRVGRTRLIIYPVQLEGKGDKDGTGAK